MELLFLSFTTLSSTGLSDVVPIKPFARSLVMIEQLAGLAYVAMVVSRLVGLTVMRRAERPCGAGAARRARTLPRERLVVDAERVVAGREVAAAVVDERRLDRRADVRRVAAARVEAAAGRRVDRARDVALQHDPLAPLGEVRVRDRDGRQQRLGVGMIGRS